MANGIYASFKEDQLRNSLYRPFVRRYLYFDPILNNRRYLLDYFFPTLQSEGENRLIVVSDHGHRSPFSVLLADTIVDLHLLASNDAFQCFPLYTYDEDGTNRRDNVTDWALTQYQTRYGAAVTKRDIFHYIYALLHHPEYRSRYAENLKRELPRVPYVATSDAFRALVIAGERLAQLHLHYEQQAEYKLDWIQNSAAPWSWRVEKMRLSPDMSALVVNQSLTLAGIPPETFSYRLGNRSALDWVVDQYQVRTDARTGITSDPNRLDDEEYIARLVGKVITVSVETVKCVAAIAPLDLHPPS